MTDNRVLLPVAGNSPRLQIEYMPLKALKLNTANPRQHGQKQITNIARNINNVGFVVPSLIDDKASGTPLIQSLRHEGLQGIIPIDPDKDKKTRMYGQTPKLEARALILPETAPWLGDFLSEYLAFPGSDATIRSMRFLNFWAGNQIAK